MNADHLDAVSLYAAHFARASGGGWVMTGCDADGIDLASGDEIARIFFPCAASGSVGTAHGPCRHGKDGARRKRGQIGGADPAWHTAERSEPPASAVSMHPIRITDPDDPRVAAFRDIRERDLVGRQGLLVAEGKVVLDVLLAAPGFETLSLLLLENRVAGLSDTLARVPPATPVHVAEARVIDAIAGFHMHRGILALGRRRKAPAATELLEGLPPRALVLVLAGISNHDNAGAIFRNAAAFGADAVFLDAACCDPLYRKAIRVSVGGVFRVPFARFEHIDGFLGLLGRHGFQRRCTVAARQDRYRRTRKTGSHGSRARNRGRGAAGSAAVAHGDRTHCNGFGFR